ncbi:hypothetical protein KAFR_0E00370 [Kazachstania africana CBS 2517]|uniref:Protein SUR7 n=1 Tax=Kazachstania africana (strain ATCC 22294 / BCRC 22015 / CBS 2517 / CECT 1963 / NBRC 1671 / NRRL Y-8276) TaxID=1071382 RepID=H2AUZ1_KAZAF|nr:hypothetical protein KAFR_0E00370 [Kazachstania africana CBS 2517]CCF58191.1 hypothetical protein KAFR_0E00370 [Kazachstania africana CBS 2517]
MKLSSSINNLLRFIVLLFFAGNTLLLIFIVMSGSINHSPITSFYWVEGDTSGIANAPNVTRWTYWGACSRDDGSTHCNEFLGPAYPISPKDNFNTEENVPHSFISKRDSFFYLSRFSFVFFGLALSFVGMAFLFYMLTIFSSQLVKSVFIMMVFGCLFDVCATVLQTAVSVMARNAFHDANRSAKLGASLFGIMWASVFVSLVKFFILCFWISRKDWKEPFDYSSNPTSKQNNFTFRKFFSGNEPDTRAVPDPVINNETFPAEQDQAQPQPTQPQENTHKGINFFTIRRGQKTADDVSV